MMIAEQNNSFSGLCVFWKKNPNNSLHFPGSTGTLSVKAEESWADPVTAKSSAANRGSTLEFSGCFPWKVFQVLPTLAPGAALILYLHLSERRNTMTSVYTLCYMSTMQCKLAFLISLDKGEVPHTWYLTKSNPIPRMHVFWPMKR